MASSLGPDQNEHLCSKLHEMLSSCQWEEAVKRLDRDHHVQIVDSSFQNDEEKYDFICKYLEQLPIETKFEDGRGYLALYIAVEFGAPYELVGKVIKSNPEAISKKCFIDGVYPLHFACAPREIGPSTHTEKSNKKIDLNQADVIRHLFKKSKNIIYERNEEGNSTPFHLLLEHSPPLDLVQYIIKNAPPPTSRGQPLEKIKDIQGRLPIHIALDNDADSDVIMCLLERYEGCVRIKQKNPEGQGDNLPLHLATSRGCSEEVLQFLLKEYPGALAVKGAFQDTPFHLIFYQYERKFTLVEGKSTHNDHCNIERMIRLMVDYLHKYYKNMRKSKQATKNNVVKILFDRENHYENKSFHDLMLEAHEKFSLPESLLSYINSILSDAVAHDQKTKRNNKAKPRARKPTKNTINPRKKQKTNTKKIPSNRPITKNTTSTIDHGDEKSLSGISILKRIMREDGKSPDLNLEQFSRFPSPIHESPQHSMVNEDDSPNFSDEENRVREYARKHFKEDENNDLNQDDKSQVEESLEEENISILGERNKLSVSSGESNSKQNNGRNETENKQFNSENPSENLSPMHEITPERKEKNNQNFESNEQEEEEDEEKKSVNDRSSEDETEVQSDNEEGDDVYPKSPQCQYRKRRTINIGNPVDGDLHSSFITV